MKNKKIWLGMILVAVFAFAVSSCDLLEEKTVPSWAQGKWYLTAKTGSATVDSIRPLALEITSKEFKPTSEIPVLKKAEVLDVSDNKVTFGIYQVEKGATANQLEVGLLAGEKIITVYK